jgi:transcriptional regulator PpsR
LKRIGTEKSKLAAADAEAAIGLICSAMDVSLIVDTKGVVRKVSCDKVELCTSKASGRCRWVGRNWVDTVTVESRPKIDELVRDANAGAPPRWRQVNHPTAQGEDIPIMYCAIRLGESGRIMVVGRDLRPMATLQQRLVSAQLSMEREYGRLRQVETRYRMLFQISSEAVTIVDASSGRVVEANPAAAELLKTPMRRLVGYPLSDRFDANGQAALESLFAAARVSGRVADATLRLADGSREFHVSASLFREDKAAYLLVRAAPFRAADAVGASDSRVLDVIDGLPDGFVVTDGEGHVLSANRAFLEMAELADEQQALNGSFDRWLGRPGVDLSVLLASLREHGRVRTFTTSIRGSHGAQTDVEICAVATPRGKDTRYGFSIHDVSPRLASAPRSEEALPRSVQQMTELVGRVPLKDLVRETTDMIERLCIEAALELSGDNRATAADLLGLSRQSLYVKLRRYGLGELEHEAVPN